MQTRGFPNLKNLDQFKSLYGSASGAAKTLSIPSRPSTDSKSCGNFTNLKLTAEKLMKEQASVKSDLEIANAKLKKSLEHVHLLEEKLQNSFNENSKLKVKQKEDEKLWKGLESKFSSTKTLCDQLTETLHQLASVVQAAEKDKEFLENKLSTSSEVLESLNKQMHDLSLNLDSAVETIKIRDKELEELKFERAEREKAHRDEQCRAANLLQEKDTQIKNFEELLAADKSTTENLNSKLVEVHLQLQVTEDEIRHHIITQEKLEKENSDLQLCNAAITEKLNVALQEIKDLEGLLEALAGRLVELDRENLKFLSKFDKLNSLYTSYFRLVQVEKDAISSCAQNQYDKLNNRFLSLMSEKDAIQSNNQELSSNVSELQKVLEFTKVQCTEELRLAAERIQILESDAETLMSKKAEAEVLISKLEEKIKMLAESCGSSEKQIQDLLLKISAFETENKENTERLQADILKKSEEIDILQKERMKLEQHTDSLEKQVSQLHNVLEEKEQLILHYKEQEKRLEDQIKENQLSLTDAENKLLEAKKQYELMVENKQLELSRHLKEISQRNDQAINDIRKKYELEMMEIANKEKDKADKAIEEIEGRCNQKLAECKEESRQQLISIQNENATLVDQIQQEHDRKQLGLLAEHIEQLKRAQLQAESELREKTTSLKNEHEAQMKALRCELEDEIQKMQEELHLQKSKEDRQRALLQLQWKVMSDKPKEDQEVNSKQDYSVSTIKRRSSAGGKRSHHALNSPSFLEVTQTPMSKLLKKVENVKTGSTMSVPKRHSKVTHHEYEVETSNGRTIKRRKTRIMFEDPRKHNKNTPEARASPSVKGVKGRRHPHPSNMGDLFSEGSLNPYADDPYAFN
ncbi:hypothetical protein L6164_016083 [Bauhinia variegata]|uniref:Uncharacterized protein n=1 Tax=Bauhinia variegata TaxID=167791 RepID=A0ACB9NPW6_BAUVA|nr:hypothetical protein L6164_016083 [Bauhinia variegata]